MKEQLIKFIVGHFGIIVMWIGSAAVCYKMLDRTTDWVFVPVVAIMLIVAGMTSNILSPKPEPKKKPGPKKAKKNGK